MPARFVFRIRRSEKTPSSSVRHAGQIESGRSFKSVFYRRTWSLQSQELHEMDDALPLASHIVERGRTYQVAGHTNTSVESPGGRLSSRQGAEISANAGSGHGLGSRPPTCIPRRRRNSLPCAERRGRRSTWFPSTIGIGRIGRNSPIGPLRPAGRRLGALDKPEKWLRLGTSSHPGRCR